MDTAVLEITCPSCGAVVAGDASWAGEHTPCPKCGRDLTFPDAVQQVTSIGQPEHLEPSSEPKAPGLLGVFSGMLFSGIVALFQLIWACLSGLVYGIGLAWRSWWALSTRNRWIVGGTMGGIACAVVISGSRWSKATHGDMPIVNSTSISSDSSHVSWEDQEAQEYGSYIDRYRDLYAQCGMHGKLAEHAILETMYFCNNIKDASTQYHDIAQRDMVRLIQQSPELREFLATVALRSVLGDTAKNIKIKHLGDLDKVIVDFESEKRPEGLSSFDIGYFWEPVWNDPAMKPYIPQIGKWMNLENIPLDVQNQTDEYLKIDFFSELNLAIAFAGRRIIIQHAANEINQNKDIPEKYREIIGNYDRLYHLLANSSSVPPDTTQLVRVLMRQNPGISRDDAAVLAGYVAVAITNQADKSKSN